MTEKNKGQWHDWTEGRKVPTVRDLAKLGAQLRQVMLELGNQPVPASTIDELREQILAYETGLEALIRVYRRRLKHLKTLYFNLVDEGPGDLPF